MSHFYYMNLHNLQSQNQFRSVSGNAARFINLVNKPLPFSQESQIAQLYVGTNTGFNIAFNTGFGMAFVTAMFVVFYIRERISRAKLLQFVSGVNKVIFWMTSYIIDYSIFILISLAFIAVLAAYQQDGIKTFEELARNFLILFLFGFAVFPFTYVCSFMFQIPASGLVTLSIGYIVTGVFTFMAFFILNNEALGLQYVAKPLGWIFLIFPHYSLTRGMSNLFVKQSTIDICEQQCSYFPQCSIIGVKAICDTVNIDCEGEINDPNQGLICTLKNSCCDTNFYSLNETGVGIQLIALTVIGCVSFCILFAIEYRWIQNLYSKIMTMKRR